MFLQIEIYLNQKTLSPTAKEPTVRRNSNSRVPLIAAITLALTATIACTSGAVGAEADNTDIMDKIINDWMIQDHGNKNVSGCFTNEANADVETKMMEKVLAELGDSGKQYKEEMDKLVADKTPGKDPAWKDLYVNACTARREARLETLLKQTKRIVFTKHYNMGASHYAYTEGLSDAQAERHFRPGTALCILEMDGPFGKVNTLIEDKGGVIRDPDVCYDGQKILFSWKKSDREDDYHLYEMDVASGDVRQLTEGLGYADYEGVYLPNDEIMFNSTRCIQTVDCWWTEVSNLYKCDKDGKNLHRISFDQVHTNYPQVLEDGRVIYTRWDYNDRGQIYPQPLFQMNIDGTAQTEYYGNNSWWPTTVMHARGIPGTDKLIALASGHHSRQTGALIVIDAKKGRQEATGATLVAPLVEDKEDRRYRRVDGYMGFDGHYQYPYALNEKEYLASYSDHQTGVSMNGFSLYYVREDAARELLAHDDKISCNQPVLLMPRKRPALRPSTVDYRKNTGTYYMQDIYFGPGLKDIPRGTIKKLRVVGLEFRAAGVASNGNGGPGGGALVSTPVAIRNGTWDVKVILGETPVYEDGSAAFIVPARTPLYFQAIDEHGHVVQSMRSWSTLMPGETFSCVGCHEDKNSSGPTLTSPTEAMKVGAKKLDEFYGPARGFSFPKEIQPILDRHCIKCHDDRSKKPKFGAKKDDQVADAKPGEKKEKKAFSLLGEKAEGVRGGRIWSDSYVNLTQNGRPNEVVNWLNVQSIPPMLPPYHAGAHKSRLLKMLKAGHNDVKITQEELDKLACWMDLLIPYCGDYMEANAWGDGGVKKYEKFLDKRRKMEEMDRRSREALIKKQTGETVTLEN